MVNLLEVKMVGEIIIKELGVEGKKKYPQPLVDLIEESGMDEYDAIVATDSESLFQLLKREIG